MLSEVIEFYRSTRSDVFCKKGATLLKKRLWHRCFPVNFVKFPRTPFLTEHLWWLFLFGKATNAWKKNSSKKLKSALFKKRADGSDMISQKSTFTLGKTFFNWPQVFPNFCYHFSTCLSISHFVSRSICLSLSLFLCVSFSLCLSISLSFFLFSLPLSTYLSFFLSVSISLRVDSEEIFRSFLSKN